MSRLLTYSLLLSALLMGCIESFDPGLPSTLQETELVVEGFITDYDSEQTVRLTRTQALNDNGAPELESGATITLLDSLGNEYLFSEFSEGVYTIDSSIFQPEYGNFYRINIKLIDGSSFSSDFQELKKSEAIDSIWYRTETIETEPITTDELPSIDEFVQLYTYLKESENVLFSYNGRYEYIAPFQGSTSCWLRDRPDPESIPSALVCYLPDQSTNPLNILSGRDVIDPTNTERNIATIRKDIKFAREFSILIEKYTLTDSYHEYLSQIKSQTENGDELFAPPPTEIFGNIISDNNPAIVARGFFTTLGKAEKRILIDDIPFNLSDDASCALIETPTSSRPAQRYCCNCRLFPGAITEKPAYWDN